jgi:hypothetical protein
VALSCIAGWAFTGLAFGRLGQPQLENIIFLSSASSLAYEYQVVKKPVLCRMSLIAILWSWLGVDEKRGINLFCSTPSLSTEI